MQEAATEQKVTLETRVAMLEKERDTANAQLQLMDKKLEALTQQLDQAMRLIGQLQIWQSGKVSQFTAIQSPPQQSQQEPKR